MKTSKNRIIKNAILTVNREDIDLAEAVYDQLFDGIYCVLVMRRRGMKSEVHVSTGHLPLKRRNLASS